MSNYNSTGFSGKNWMAELYEKRVGVLMDSLKNGGRGLTFEELKDKVNTEVPGGQPIGEKAIKKAVYATEHNISVKSAEDLWAVKLPTGGGARRWENEREKKRLAFSKQGDARSRYNKKLKKMGVKALGVGKGWKKKRKKTNPIEAITMVQAETSLTSILSNLSDIPSEFKEEMKKVEGLMQKHKFCKVELSIGSTGSVLKLVPVAQEIVGKLT